MARTADVVAGTLIQSAWGNEIRDRTVQQFATTAERDTWAGPPAGAVCITTDTMTLWRYTGTTWVALDTQPHCRIWRNAVQSIPNTTVTAVSFTAARTDVGPMWAIGQPTRITFPVAGFYLMGGTVAYASAGTNTGVRTLTARRNGTETIGGVASGIAAAGIFGTDVEVVTAYQMAAGDYVEFMAYHTQGAALNISASPNYSPEAWATRLTT